VLEGRFVFLVRKLVLKLSPKAQFLPWIFYDQLGVGMKMNWCPNFRTPLKDEEWNWNFVVWRWIWLFLSLCIYIYIHLQPFSHTCMHAILLHRHGYNRANIYKNLTYTKIFLCFLQHLSSLKRIQPNQLPSFVLPPSFLRLATTLSWSV
jgi:hypothetical protein